jgi:hypothetical protein
MNTVPFALYSTFDLDSVTCGDAAGSVHLVDLVRSTLGAIRVTAMDFANRPAVRLPASLERHPLQEPWLGRAPDRPRPACHARLLVSPFIAVWRTPGQGRSDVVRGDQR